MTILRGIRKSIFGSGEHGKPALQFDHPVAPDEPFIAIGDIHGHVEALIAILRQIERAYPKAHVVCVGDYVDRGEASADVLTILQDLSQTDAHGVTCLAGNHETMLVKFIDDPVGYGRKWLKHGGLQTLASYGVAHTGMESIVATRDALVSAMGGAMIDWLRGLPLFWRSGNVAVVHAAADPNVPLEAQSSRTLLWGHPQFTQAVRADGVWVIHGHTIVDQSAVVAGRVAIDTGAYATGRLTAVYVSAEGFEFFSSV